MNRRRVGAAILAAIIGLNGCGGAPRAEVAEMYVSVATENGFDVDPDCVERVLGAMDDDDVNKLSEAGLDGNADLTEQGYKVLLTDIPNQCIDVNQYRDNLLKELAADPTVDVDCVAAALADATSADDVDRALDSAVRACSGGGV